MKICIFIKSRSDNQHVFITERKKNGHPFEESERLGAFQYVRFELVQLRKDLFLWPVNQINNPPYLRTITILYLAATTLNQKPDLCSTRKVFLPI